MSPIAYEQSLLYGEHTWGASLGWVGHGLPWGADWRKGLDDRHKRMVASWDEHTAYANAARGISGSLLEGELERLSQSIGGERTSVAVYNPLPWKRSGMALIDGEPRAVEGVPPMGYRAVFADELNRPETTRQLTKRDLAGEGVLENKFFRVGYDRRLGRVTSLVDKRAGRELVRPGSGGLGSFLHERFSADQCDRFMRDYNLAFPKWVTTQFTKPMLPREVPYKAAGPDAATGIVETHHTDYSAIRFEYEGDAALPCKKLEMEVRLYEATPAVDITLAIQGKRPDTWPEAGWMACR